MSVLYLMSKILSLIKDLSCVCFFVLFFFCQSFGISDEDTGNYAVT